jgi:plasmid stability protein
MANVTIGNLDNDVKRRLGIRSAEHGRSMEEEAREILLHVVDEAKPTDDLAEAICARIASQSVVALDIPQREAMREPHPFDRA